MKTCLDASVIVAIFTDDASTLRAEELRSRPRLSALVSDLAAAEFASVVARRVRTGELTRPHAEAALHRFDGWLVTTERIETMSADIRAAEAMMRRFDLPPRTPDALNIALARRTETTLATFDRQMAGAARALGLDVID